MKYFYTPVILLLFLMAGCSALSEMPGAELLSADGTITVVKSANDHKDYRSIELPNQLRVLLVSDPQTDKSAASLDVFVGSRQDPKSYQGLAHFLEHMLFLGTEKYPEPEAYLTYISEHSGGHNAYTAFEHTNYFFDIDPQYLDGALDRFSQFFIAPLFTDSYVQREKNAVNSEYLSKIKSDQRKSLDVMKAVINKDHPFSKFSVGNLGTLNGGSEKALRNSLLDFYQQYYSANIMTLVVIGREPLDDLENMVVTRFSKIPNRNAEISKIKEPLFIPADLPMSVAITPEKEQRALSIIFPIPDASAYYQQKPMHYLGNIIGHEGEGSLLSYLKKQGWAEGLSAGTGLTYEGGAMFSVNVMLTPQGLAKKDDVVKAVFQIINRIRENKNGQGLYKEQQSIAATQFRFQESGAPMNLASQLAGSMHYYPAVDILQGPYLMEQYDAALVGEFLTYLRPDNVFLMLSAPGVETDRVTRFYQTQYQQKAISEAVFKQWQLAGVNEAIIIPKKNEFIAEDFSLVAGDTQTPDSKLISPELLTDSSLKLWYLQDTVFDVPKGSIYFSLRSPLANQSARDALMLKLTTRLMSDRLNEYSYPATLAGLHYAISSGLRGITVKISGYTEKQALLLEKILDNINDQSYDEKRFNNIKSELKRQLENQGKGQPFRLLMAKLQKSLVKGDWEEDVLLAEIDGIELSDLESYQTRFMASLEVNALVHGNYSKAQAEDVAEQLSAALLDGKIKASLPKIGIAELALQESTITVESDYTDAALLLYIQTESLDISERIAMGLTAQIVSAPFFSRLRTEQQLGYIVSSGPYPVWDVPGMFFVVQSPVAGVKDLQREINRFIQLQHDGLQNMTAEEFEKHRQSLLQRLSEAPKNLSEQTAYLWDSIGKGYDDFDIKEQLIVALKALTFDQWKQFFSSQMMEGKRHALWIDTQGKFVDQQLHNTVPLGDSVEAKARKNYYSFD